MMNSPLGSRSAIGHVLGVSRPSLQTQWFLAGGVSAANCIAAYTPKGAASLAASYDNNAAPGNGLADGTYDAAPGVAPTFDTATGWAFNGSTQYLTTGYTPPASQSQSFIVRFSDAGGTSQPIAGLSNGLWGILAYWPIEQPFQIFQNGNQLISSFSPATSGVGAVAGAYGYFNGTASTGTIGDWTTANSYQFWIGGRNGSSPRYATVKIQALAIYNVTLDAATVAAISAAMAAL